MRAADILLIGGPTASGKSSYAIALANALAQDGGAVIINADASQLYADLEVLSARPNAEESAQAEHRLYGVLPAHQAASAALWQTMALKEIAAARTKGATPIVVGGTGMYLNALAKGFSPIPDVSPAVREALHAECEARGLPAIYEELQACDPALHAKLKPNDTQRILRAVEVFRASGQPLSYWQAQPAEAPLPNAKFHCIEIAREREELYDRCNQRVDVMLEDGAIEEVQALLAQNISAKLPIMRTIGVPEIGAYLRGEHSLKEAAEQMKTNTRHYAKRQVTWFKHQWEAETVTLR